MKKILFVVGITSPRRDYSTLKLKPAHIIIPAYTEDEILNITAAIDTTSPFGLPYKAIILLEGGDCGLRWTSWG